MAYHTLLVHLDSGPTCAARVELATRLALEHGSHLIGLAPTGEIQIPVDIASTLLEPGFLTVVGQQLHDAAARACQAFEATAAAADLSSFESRIYPGDHAQSVIAQARGADVVVVGQTDPEAPAGIVPADLPERVTLGSGRPVLVVPYAGQFKAVGHRVLAAWNDSREAARAFCDALPLMQRALKVTLLTQRALGSPLVPPVMLEAWLARHGVKVTFADEVSDLPVGDLLLSRAADLDADLIVMGCYGHSRLSERVLGGATRTLLTQMTAPVLMAH